SPDESPYLFGYGLGWMTGLYKGHYLVAHGGNIDGFASTIILLPKMRLGIVVLSNNDGHPYFANCLSCAIADYALDLTSDNWLKEVQEKETMMKELLMGKKDETTSLSVSARPLSDYEGEFENSGYGSIRVFSNEG